MTGHYEHIVLPIEKLTAYENNARTHSDKQIKQVRDSIVKFGFTNPVLVDPDHQLIAGHGRLLGAKAAGLKELPCIVITGLTETEQRALVLADNQLALNAGWDLDMLKLELSDLIDDEFDMDLIGFEEDFINELVLDDDDVDGITDEDEIPEAPEIPTSVLGDLWQLGNHRLMCGDSTDIESVDKMMDGGKANACFTDPPYLMDFTGGIHADGSKSFNATHGGIKNDKMSDKEGEDFLDAINAIIKLKVDGAFYITFYRLGIDKYYASMARTGLQSRSLIIWDKGNHTLSNSDYMSMYEPMFYGWVNNHKFYGGKNGMDIWRIKRTAKNDLHPTMKPVELVVKALEDGTQINGVVLDLFGGSGTTLIAAEKKNRHARLMELDEKYVDVIINRWQDFTGKEAVHVDSGLTFNELKAQRIAE